MCDDAHDEYGQAVHLDNVRQYVGEAQFVMYLNADRYMPEAYGEDVVIKYSRIIERQFSSHAPEFAVVRTTQNIIED